MYDDGYDEDGNLTPRGLAMWADDEGGMISLWRRNGSSTFIEAGVSPEIMEQLETAIEAFEQDLKRIGAEI